MADLKRIRRSVLATAIGVCTLWAAAMAPAHASLVGTTVDVTFDSPNDGPFTASNTGVLVGAGVEITAGDGSDVGDNAMLPGAGVSEFIDIGDFSITLRLLAGDSGPPPITGWGTNARYIFSGLGIAGFDIVGVTATSLFGITNFDSSWASFDSPSQVSFRVDLVEFAAGVGGVSAYGDVSLTLQTRPNGGGTVPEPGSLALVAMAMLSLWGASRRRVIG